MAVFANIRKIVSPFPVLMNARRGNQFKFGGNGKFQTDCVPYSIFLTQEIPATSVRFRTFSDISGQKIQQGAKALKIVRKQLG